MASWEKLPFDIDSLFDEVCVQTLPHLNFPKSVSKLEISVLLTSDVQIQTYNKHYRHKDKPTNVLSFPTQLLQPYAYKKLRGDILLGDMVFAYEVIEAEALEQQKPFAAHLTHLIVHSLLHLVGFDHEKEEDAAQMETLEVAVLKELSLPNPYQ